MLVVTVYLGIMLFIHLALQQCYLIEFMVVLIVHIYHDIPISTKFFLELFMSNKYRKPHTLTFVGDISFKQRQSFTLSSYGIRILKAFNITKKQISQYKAVITKALKALNRANDHYYKGLYYQTTPPIALSKVNAYPYNSLTSKSQGSRMGKGKGSVEDYYFPIKAGTVLIELGYVDVSTAEHCYKILKYKMPVPIRLVSLSY